jgi:hypothetical protein
MRRAAAKRYRLKVWKKSLSPNPSPANPLKLKNQPALSIKKSKTNNEIPACQFCGRKGYVVKKFPRRPYGKKTLNMAGLFK